MRGSICLLAVAALVACDESRSERVDRLIRSLHEGVDWSEREDAAEALGRIRGEPAEWPYGIEPPKFGIGALPPDPDVERAARALTRTLRDVDEEPLVRDEAAVALGRLRTPGPHPNLIECALYEPDISYACEGALLVTADPADLDEIVGLIGTRPGRTMEKRDLYDIGDLHALVDFRLAELGERAIPYLERVVREDRDDEYAVGLALQALRAIDTAAAYEVIALALDDPHSLHRYEAVQFLYELGNADPKYLPKVRRLLADPSEGVRSKVARVLGVPEPPPPTEPLRFEPR